MALRTSVGTGVWSAAGTWDTGVPVDTDTFLIAAGHTVTFDVDQSAFAGLGASTIAATGTLIASTTAGAYVLKMNADLTNNGTIQAGTSTSVPYPSTCTFTVNFSAGSNSIVNGATGKIYFYCVEPTNYYASLTAQEPATETAIAVDYAGDLDTADIWTAGKTVGIVDIYNAGIESESTTIASTTAGVVNIAAGGLAAQKEIGAVIFLITRNIRITNGTDWAINLGTSTGNYVAAEITTDYGVIAGLSSTIGGCVCTPAVTGINGVSNVLDSTIIGVVATLRTTGTPAGITSCRNITMSNTGLLAGFYYGSQDTTNLTMNGLSVGMNRAHAAPNSVFNGEMRDNYYQFYSNSSFVCYGDIIGGNTALYLCNDFTLANNTISSPIAFYSCGDGRLYNVNITSGTEFSGYNDNDYRQIRSYVESSDHDQVINAYKVWCLGGIVTSQTASPPTGYTIFYRHAVENASYPVFRQFLTTVASHTTLEVDAVIRNTDGIDVSATSPIDLRPRLEIIDVFSDPLVDSTATPLDTVALPVSDGTNTTWQEVKGIWSNTGDAPRQVYVRILAYSHDTSNHNIDEAWAIADYQDQIAALYAAIIPVRTEVSVADTTTSFTLEEGQASLNAYRYNTIMVQDATDAHWEQRKIIAYTAGRVVTVGNAFTFTPAVGDLAYILSVGYGASVEEVIKRIKRLSAGSEV